MHNPNRSVSEFNITLLDLSFVNRETHCTVDHVSLSLASQVKCCLVQWCYFVPGVFVELRCKDC